MYMYECTGIYTYLNMHIYIRIYKCFNVYISISIHKNVYIYICKYI